MTSSSGRESIACSTPGFRRVQRPRHAAALALFPLVCLLMLAPARSAGAGEFNVRGDSGSALREYAEARQIGAAQAPAGTVEWRFGGSPERAAAADRYMD